MIDGDVFRTIVPLDLSHTVASDKPNSNDHNKLILEYLAKNSEINAAIAAKIIDRSHGTARRILSCLVNEGIIKSVGANRNRKYRLENV